MQNDEYQTISSPSEGLYKEKGSRFLSFAYPVFSVEEAKAIVEQKQKEFHDARHHCFAWSIGHSETRMSDDGEPSGTAGKPIFGQILSANLSNILIVVVRYFGGIKLGTGGLIVAYKTAAADAIANAQVVLRLYEDIVSFSFPYLSLNDVMKTIKKSNANIIEQNFDNNCNIKISIRKSDTSNLILKLTDLGCSIIE